MGWNGKNPSTEGNNITTEASCAGISGLMNPDDSTWQMLFASLLQTMLQEFMEKLTEQITEKVTPDVAWKMRREMANLVDPAEVMILAW